MAKIFEDKDKGIRVEGRNDKIFLTIESSDMEEVRKIVEFVREIMEDPFEGVPERIKKNLEKFVKEGGYEIFSLDV